MPGATIKDCLDNIGVGPRALNGCASVLAEWAIIKRSYFKSVLANHPDKGGDAAVFREVQASFEVLRRLFDSQQVESFQLAQDESTAESYKGSRADFKDAATPSWEYYAAAAKEDYATYRVELAKSGRSRCQKSGSLIEKGTVRIGFMTEAGTYGMFCQLCHWRVPSKVWLGLPDPARCRDRRKFDKALQRMNQVALSGLEELPAKSRKEVIRYVMDKTHWTFGGNPEKVRKKPAAASTTNEEEAEEEERDGDETPAAPRAPSRGRQSDIATTSTELVPLKKQFSIPTPGRDGPGGSLSGQSFVLTGVFPEIGGGQGLELGKARVRKMVESFGGRVTSSVTGKTDVLVVGKDPGFSKVSKARANANTRLVGLHDLKVGIERGSLEDAMAKPMLIRSFSKGFAKRRGGPNGLALKASKEELAIASGTKAPARRLDSKGADSKAKRGGTRLATGVLKRPASASASSGKARRTQ